MAGRESERDRQLRVADQMMTMHSVLRDRYRRRALMLSCLLLTSSAALCALVFVDDVHLRSWHLDPSIASDLIGLMSVLLFIGSIIELRVDWSGRARIHDHAVRRLFQLVSLIRSSHSDGGVDASLADEYRRTMNDIAPVPDSDFNRLKAHHLFKVALSKRISRSPQTWLWLLYLQLRLEGVAAILKNGEKVNE